MSSSVSCADQLIGVGYAGDRDSWLVACRALGWEPKGRARVRQAADRMLAARSAPMDPTLTPSPPAAPADSSPPGPFSFPDGPRFPASPVPAFEVQRLRCDAPVAVVSDAHIPSHDPALLARVARCCKARGVELMVWLGDTIDAGQMHRRSMHEHHYTQFSDDLDLAEAVLTEMARWVPRMALIQGNHERFMRHRLGGHIEEGVLLAKWFRSLGDRLTVVPVEQAELVQAGQRWTLVHGTSSAQNVLLTLQKYAMRFGTHVAMGHVHLTAAGNWNGYSLACVAGVHDPARLLYAHQAPRPLPRMDQSWGIIERGEMTIYRAADPSW